MIRLLIDTNVVLDLLAKREPFYIDAARIFSLADKSKLSLHISSLSFANTNYVLSRLKSANDTRELLRRFRVLVKIIALTDKIIDLALNDNNFQDFEDGIKYYTGIENNIDIIITRDLKDFKGSKIPVMTPDEYLNSKKY
jgi:predicted nucleic acid-binding protein